MLILSPRAVERLERFRPPRPLPKLFPPDQGRPAGRRRVPRRHHQHALDAAVEDALDGLRWAERIGGLPALIARSEDNLRLVAEWVERTPWVDFLAARPDTRSSTSICLKLVDPDITALPRAAQAALIKDLVARLEAKAWPTTSPPIGMRLPASGCGAARRWNARPGVPAALAGLGVPRGQIGVGARQQSRSIPQTTRPSMHMARL